MSNRPKVVVHQVASVDGRLAISPSKLMMFGDERWDAACSDNKTSWEGVKSIYKPEATLEGSGSFALEGVTPDPLPPVEGDPAPLYNDFLPDHIVHRPNQRGWFTAVDSRGRMRWMYKEFPSAEWAGWYALVLVSHKTPADYLAYLRREDIPYLVAGDDKVDLACALEKMKTLLGVNTLLSTAGGKMNGALLRAGLIDELSIDFFPALIGGFQTPSLFDSPELKPDESPTHLTLIASEVFEDGRVWLRYAVKRTKA